MYSAFLDACMAFTLDAEGVVVKKDMAAELMRMSFLDGKAERGLTRDEYAEFSGLLDKWTMYLYYIEFHEKDVHKFGVWRIAQPGVNLCTCSGGVLCEDPNSYDDYDQSLLSA